jgi:purine-nucleoside phosphorylase
MPANDEFPSMRDRIQDSVDAIRNAAGEAKSPRVAIVFGTGLTSLANDITDAVSVPYDAIPHFPAATVETHTGELVLGKLGGCDVVAMRGRFHFYEGYSLEQITHPVRVMHALGAETLVLSNAAGGLNPKYSAGDICILDDHINLLGTSPLVGPNDEELGVRFPDMSQPYNQELVAAAEAIALDEGIRTHRSVYTIVSGPNLETRAEYRFLRTIGSDLIGMSTVPEAIVAAHEGLRCIAFSIVTDTCLPDALVPVSVEEIIATAAGAEPHLNTIVRRLIGEL